MEPKSNKLTPEQIEAIKVLKAALKDTTPINEGADPAIAERRIKWLQDNLELLKKAKEKGHDVSLQALYMNNEVWAEFVKSERTAQIARSVEQDIITAITFNRHRQAKGETSATVDYNKLEL